MISLRRCGQLKCSKTQAQEVVVCCPPETALLLLTSIFLALTAKSCVLALPLAQTALIQSVLNFVCFNTEEKGLFLLRERNNLLYCCSWNLILKTIERCSVLCFLLFYIWRCQFICGHNKKKNCIYCFLIQNPMLPILFLFVFNSMRDLMSLYLICLAIIKTY